MKATEVSSESSGEPFFEATQLADNPDRKVNSYES